METISKLINSWEKLSLDDKEYAIAIFHKSIEQEKRELLLKRIEDAEYNFENNLTKSGSVSDLMADLEND